MSSNFGLKNPIVSVIVPIYNAEKFLKRAVRSLINQPCFSDMEVILIDDGSKDSSPILCDEFARDYDNIFVIHKQNEGVGRARNDGLDRAKGKYIAFLDSDDWYSEKFFTEDLMERFLSEDVSIYGFSFKIITFNFKYYTIDGRARDKELCSDIYGGIKYERQPFWSFIYNAKMIKDNGLVFFPVKYNEDFAFTEMCFYLAKRVKFVDKLLYVYWLNLSSAMHTVSSQGLFNEHYKSLMMLKEWHDSRKEFYDPNEQILGTIAQYILPEVCAKGEKSSQEFFDNDDRFVVMREFEHYEIRDEYKKRIKEYLEQPHNYCRKAKKALRFKNFQNFLYKHKMLKSILMGFYYGLINKKEKLSKQEIKKLKKQAL